MNVGVVSFTPSRLVLARERRGMTQRQLSEMVCVSERMIKAYESGEKCPTTETLRKLARELAFPVAFFEASAVDPITLESASFRALTKTSAAVRGRAVAAGTIAMDLHRFIADRFDLPRPDVPDLGTHLPMHAAEAVRHSWGLGQKPIANVIHLLEFHGVRVFSLSEDCDSIDAFSVWRDGVPFVFLNTRKTAERSIFDAAHELGHLVLHRHGAPQGQTAEAEANRFASSFLLPERAIRAAAPHFATLATVAAMKRSWKVSVAALGFRLHELRLMTEWHYRHFNIELARRPKDRELEPLPRETSAILRKVMNVSADGISPREIAEGIHVPVSEVRALSFGLQAMDGDQDRRSVKRGELRLVKS